MTSSSEPRLPSRTILYDEPSTETFELAEVADYVEERTGLKVERRKGFMAHFKPKDRTAVAGRLAASRVKRPDRVEDNPAMYGEVKVEERLLAEPNLRIPGVLYDGYKLHGILQSAMPKREKSLDIVHVAFTNRLLATFDADDGRYHARVIVCGYPSIISTSGIVEAPAKPRGFYAARQKLESRGIYATEVIKEFYRGDFVEYDDERMTEVMKGYAMQALFYHLVNEPFCERKRCRLYNAHWQSEVLEAQLGGDRYCARHERMLEKVRDGALDR